MKKSERWYFILGFVIGLLIGILITNDRAVAASDTGQITQVQYVLRQYGYALPIDGILGPKTSKAISSWQKANGIKITGLINPATLKTLGLTTSATVSTPAVRVNPPVNLGINNLEFAPNGLSNCDEMQFYRMQWRLPEIFDSIGYRESRCENDAKPVTVIGQCCVGYWANYISSHLSSQSAYRIPIQQFCQVYGRDDIYGTNPLQKQKQACVTSIVFNISGLKPWAT